MRRAIFDRLVAIRRQRIPAALVTDLSTGLQCVVTADTQSGGFGLTGPQRAEVLRRIADDDSGLVVPGNDGDGEELDGASRLLVVVHNPPARLLIVGAVHIAQALAPMAVLAGYAVTVIDPRGAFANAERFPGSDICAEWPDTALTGLAIDTRTAVVTLSHDPKLDDPALLVALGSPAFYVGALGSRRTHGKRLERLRAEGVSEAQLRRIRAPVGLAIEAVTPGEIAVSILAEITSVRRAGSA